MNVFRPIQHSRSAEEVAHQIEGLVLEGVLRVGDRLPGERELALETGVSRPTIREWVSGRLPHSYLPRDRCGKLSGRGVCARCGGGAHDFGDLAASYVHLLGLYLGDGSIATHRRGVYRLRITLDVKYPGIVRDCEAAMQGVLPRNRVSRQLRRCNCYEVYSYSKTWPCLFPQHGVGKKHDRPIFLSDWQQELAERWPEQLLKGLIQSDGCRSYSTGAGGWRHPRYAFANVSTPFVDRLRDALAQGRRRQARRVRRA